MGKGSTLPQDRLEGFRSRLREMRRRVSGDVDQVVEEVREEINPGGNLSTAPVHLGDLASDRLEADINVIENETVILDAIDSALRRIDDGSFGVCVACGQTIPAERLEAIPYADRCVACAEKSEKGRSNVQPEPSSYSSNEGTDLTRRRAGQRSDELLPGETVEGNAGGGANQSGTPGGGLAGGGLAGTNAGDGSYDNLQLEDAMGAGIYDTSGDNVDEKEPEAGSAGGAAGGTPAGKRSGPRLHDASDE